MNAQQRRKMKRSNKENGQLVFLGENGEVTIVPSNLKENFFYHHNGLTAVVSPEDMKEINQTKKSLDFFTKCEKELLELKPNEADEILEITKYDNLDEIISTNYDNERTVEQLWNNPIQEHKEVELKEIGMFTKLKKYFKGE